MTTVTNNQVIAILSYEYMHTSSPRVLAPSPCSYRNTQPIETGSGVLGKYILWTVSVVTLQPGEGLCINYYSLCNYYISSWDEYTGKSVSLAHR